MDKKLGLILFAALWAGCQSVNPALLDEDKKTLVQDVAPAPYRVAIGQVDWNEATDTGEGLRFRASAERLRKDLVEHLNRFNTTAVDVVLADVPTRRPDEATRTADLYIQPAIVSTPNPEALEVSSQWVAAGGFWLITWIGGLFVDDYSYEPHFTVQCRITNCHDGNPVDLNQQVHEFQSGKIDLDYWDRNTFPSLRMVESFFLPPFWTSDDPDTTSDSLTAKAIEAASARLSFFLKKRLESTVQNDIGAFELLYPESARATVPDDFELEFKITSREAVTGVAVYVNGERLLPEFEAGERGAGNMYRCTVSQPITDLLPNEPNIIRIETSIQAGRRIGRTIMVNLAK